MKHIRNRYFLISDILLLALAAYTGYVLRFESLELHNFGPGAVVFALLGIGITLALFHLAGLYARYWRYASIEELLLLCRAMTVSAALTGVCAIALVQLHVIPGGEAPRSMPFLFLLLGTVATAGPRFALRVYAHHYHKRKRVYAAERSCTRVAIMGAGDAGAMIARELQHNPQLGLEVVGFLDDDPLKHRAWIHGARVLGGRSAIVQLAAERRICQVIIAMPTASGKVIRELVRLCEQAGVRAKIIPGWSELIDGAFSVRQLRDVAIEDLLRRAPVRTDTSAVEALLRGRRVLVTGGGGSIGRELCRQVLRCHPAELVILGHGENSVFEIAEELKRAQDAARAGNGAAPPTRLHAVIADIRFAVRLHRVFQQYRPEIVFHAAAHKHVPLMETNPAEAVTNNILGTRNLLSAALAANVERFIMISTDKAVNPTSIMGVSKRVAELQVLRAAEQSGRPYAAVRFGNVLGSRGSVVLTFKQQIAAGGPVTVTHPDMTRYFMTIPEAVQLVLQAAVLECGGEVFVLDMGEPIRIVDLARDLIELSGLKLGHDIDIAFSGVRPGEKLKEELFLTAENFARTAHAKIFTSRNPGCATPCDLDLTLDELQAAAERDNSSAILSLLRDLVPEFHPEDAVTVPLSAAPRVPAVPAPAPNAGLAPAPARLRAAGGS
jgi:FlaA1/EpsC-like NDP-sugar epimerase